MSVWGWIGLAVPVAVFAGQYLLSVRLTGRPPADLYDALKDIMGGGR